MQRFLFMICVLSVIAGCDRLPVLSWPQARSSGTENPAQDTLEPNGAGQTRPVLRPEGGSGADTVAPEPAANGALGTTVVSLGNPAEPGLWLKTPLVSREQPGRVTKGGGSVNVTLIPIEGAATAGSRMSLAAMQALGISPADLTEVSVFAG
ncbi:MAG: hypothetical protein HRU30_08250 [Rhodobacteraceae bacterium]|nr:hypothetical protein [Paracoccaceae bacterium]